MRNKAERKAMMQEVYENRKKKKLQDTLNVEVYKQLKKEKVSDTKIMDQYGFHNVGFNEWKHEHGLVKKKVEQLPATSQNDSQQPKEEKTTNDTQEVQSAVNDDLATKYKTMELKYNSAVKDYEDMKEIYKNAESTIDELEQEVKDLKALFDCPEYINSQTEDVQRENADLKTRVIFLKDIESDYRKLEVDYHDLKREFDKMAHLKLLNHLLMKDSVINGHDLMSELVRS